MISFEDEAAHYHAFYHILFYNAPIKGKSLSPIMLIAWESLFWLIPSLDPCRISAKINQSVLGPKTIGSKTRITRRRTSQTADAYEVVYGR